MNQRPAMQIWKKGLAVLLVAPVAGLPQQISALDDDRLATFRQELRARLPAMSPSPVVQDSALIGFRVNRVSWQYQSRGLEPRDIVLLPGGPFVASETFEQDVAESLGLLLESRVDEPVTWHLLSSDGANREFVYKLPEPSERSLVLLSTTLEVISTGTDP